MSANDEKKLKQDKRAAALRENLRRRKENAKEKAKTESAKIVKKD